MAGRIEDYAMIGDCQTAALVSADGSLDWLCLPRFDSPACFAALLGDEENGLWRITPTGNVTAARRTYVDGSLVLETEFTTDTGCVRLTDFMPIGQGGRHVVRTEVERRLVQNRLVLRYETESEIDGLAPGEGSFLACSFWLVENYVLQGRSADAERLFGDLVGLSNDVGLLSEEYDVVDKRMLGNFPQALSHMALVNAAYALAG
jgi:GH15 family glucan-1,4-alpha-glucosidase